MGDDTCHVWSEVGKKSLDTGIEPVASRLTVSHSTKENCDYVLWLYMLSLVHRTSITPSKHNKMDHLPKKVLNSCMYVTETRLKIVKFVCCRDYKQISVTGNRTPVSRVTGGDTSHYTMTDLILFSLLM